MRITRRQLLGLSTSAVGLSAAGAVIVWRAQSARSEFAAEVLEDYLSANVTEVGGWIMSKTEAGPLRRDAKLVPVQDTVAEK